MTGKNKGGRPKPALVLDDETREYLELIEPRAGVALTSFVEHVVDTSRRSRSS